MRGEQCRPALGEKIGSQCRAQALQRRGELEPVVAHIESRGIEWIGACQGLTQAGSVATRTEPETVADPGIEGMFNRGDLEQRAAYPESFLTGTPPQFADRSRPTVSKAIDELNHLVDEVLATLGMSATDEQKAAA